MLSPPRNPANQDAFLSLVPPRATGNAVMPVSYTHLTLPTKA